jgi:quercetin dioxygenase-like cupin family protein
MIRNRNNFVANVDEIAPAPVTRDEGWREMDIRFITASVTGCKGLGFFRTVFKPGAAHERHFHPHADEFLYVISGRAAIGAEDSENEALPGTLQIIPAGRVHWLRNLDPAQPVEIVGGYLGVGSLEEAGYEFVGDITEEYQRVH